MQIVLRAIVERTRLRAADPASERVTRRSITLVPEHGAQVVVEAAA
jgi:cytochrome P450